MKYINEGQDVNHKDYSGLTPLHDAVAYGDIEVIFYPTFCLQSSQNRLWKN